MAMAGGLMGYDLCGALRRTAAFVVPSLPMSLSLAGARGGDGGAGVGTGGAGSSPVACTTGGTGGVHGYVAVGSGYRRDRDSWLCRPNYGRRYEVHNNGS